MATGLPDLSAVVADLAARVESLETWREAHNAGMARRQEQLNAMREEQGRANWLATMRRGHR